MSNILSVELDESIDVEEARRLLALSLFQAGSLGIGGSAKLAQMPYRDWWQWLSDRGVPVVEYGDDYDLEGELAAIEALDS